ncbi:MAG: ComEC/Rec2 family competence protein [Verrucomicrobia bacterium]|nr:ComEC/Rec2 family competence protein [Verrucomicrobiota bacterium]
MKRPLVMVALLYSGGLLLADFLQVPLVGLIVVTLSLAVGALLWAKARSVLLGLLVLLAGWTNLTLRTAIISPIDLRVVVGERTEFITLRGALSETPYQRVYEHHDQEPSWRTMSLVDVSELRFQKQIWRPTFGGVAISTPGILSSNFFAGQTVEVTGILRAPKGAVADGLFDYRTYLRRQGIYYQLQVASLRDWEIVSSTNAPPSPPISDRFFVWAKRTLALGLPVEDEPLRLLWAMTLGWKTALTNEVNEPFMRSGTMHIFAISGLHIALIAGILVAVLRVLQVPRAVCGLVVIPLIWFYTGVTGWQASAIRSTVMMTIIIAGWSLKRPSDLLNSLAAAAFIILIWDPQQLFQASFQLSFFVVLSLALFVPVLEKIRKRWLQSDPLLPGELRPRWQRWLNVPIYYVTAGLTTSLAAWLGSIPLIAYYFHLFTPVSLLANLIVVPLSSLALMSNLASLIVGGWFPACAELFNHSAWFWMLLMLRVSEWAANLPGGCVYIAAPSAIGFIFYYALLVSLMGGWLKRPRWRVWVAAGLALLGVAWLSHWQQERTTTRLTILPLNGGHAVYFDAPGHKNDLLVDCGNTNAAQFIVKPFLRAQGVNRLNRLLLTHGDLRQVGGAELVGDAFSVKQIATSPIQFRSPTYRNILERLERNPEKRQHVARDDRIGPWTILHPKSDDHFPQADDSSVVLSGNIQGTRILLLSDLGRPGQEVLLERTPELRADIVVTGLPTGSEPISDALLDVVQPRVIVITDSEFPATRRANEKLRERLAKRNAQVIYTRTSGAVTFFLRANHWELKPMSGDRLLK